jgi:hypothetical protein
MRTNIALRIMQVTKDGSTLPQRMSSDNVENMVASKKDFDFGVNIVKLS